MRIYRIERNHADETGNGTANWSAPGNPGVQDIDTVTEFQHKEYEPISDKAAESVRTKYIITGGRDSRLYPFLDPFSTNAYAIANKAVIDEVERLEPGAYTILPIPHGVYSIPDQRVVSQAYLVLRVYRAIDCLDMERSHVSPIPIPAIAPDFVVHALKGATKEQRVVFGAACKGLHLWANRPTGAIFCSGDFYDRIHEIGAEKGVEFGECMVA